MFEELPPCLRKILNNTDLLKEKYHLVARYFYNYSKQNFNKFLEFLIMNKIAIDPSLDLYSDFKCSDVKDLCEDSCEIKKHPIRAIMMRTQKVLHVQSLTGEDYLIITIDDKDIVIPIDVENECKAFVNEMAKKFHEVISLDKRRKEDRVLWDQLKSFWLSKAEVIDETTYLQENNEDDINLQILELVEERLYSTELTNEKYLALTSPNFSYFDGQYAYYYRNHLINHLINELKIRITPTKLSRLLKLRKLAEPVRVRINRSRYTFFKYKPCEEQISDFEKQKEVMEVD